MATTDQPASLIVCDAGPLIHLHEISALDLLADFGRVLVPAAVWREVQRHRPAALAHLRAPARQRLISWIEALGTDVSRKMVTLQPVELTAATGRSLSLAPMPSFGGWIMLSER